MVENSLLPHPKTIEEISALVEPHLNDKDLWMGKNIDVKLKMLKRGESIGSHDFLFPDMNRYLFHRAENQINEAMNKLWGTVELEFQLDGKTKQLCKKFSRNFLRTTTIPGLYYSEISAIISILSIFGVCSIVEKPEHEKAKFYNLVRTDSGFMLDFREEYLKKCFGTTVPGWHNQVLFIYKKLIKSGIRLPELNFDKVEKLKNDRNYYHYDLLGQPSMYGVFETNYFEHLPHVVGTIRTALDTIHEIKNPLPCGCDERFEELKEKIKEKFGVNC